jgi:glutaredoxin
MRSFHSALGATRSCPHCKTTILQSSASCPACRHLLRFDAAKAAAGKPLSSMEPLRLEATVRQPEDGDGCEYSLVVVVTNDRGEELTRQVVSVGSLKPAEARTFAVWVEAFSPEAVRSRQLLEASTAGLGES